MTRKPTGRSSGSRSGTARTAAAPQAKAQQRTSRVSRADRARAEKKRRRNVGIGIGVGAGVLLAGGYLWAAAAVGSSTPADATVAGIDVGGLTETELRETLSRELAPRADAPVALTAGERTAELDPAEAGLALDVDATAADMVGFTLDPRALWLHVVGDHSFAPVTTVDDSALENAAGPAAEALSATPEDAALAIEEGEPAFTEGVDGQTVDPEAVVTTVQENWLLPTDPLSVEAEVTEPAITTAEAQEALSGVAEPALSGDIGVTATGGDIGEDDADITVSPAAIADTLRFEAVDGTLRPVFDALDLKTAVLGDNPDAVSEPENARFDLSGDAPQVVPARNGTTIDSKTLASVVTEAMTRSGEERTGSLPLVAAEPELTTEEAEAVDLRQTVSAFATDYHSEPNRDTNLRVASEQVSGTVVMPGETFSLNETLGQRTAAAGYRPAGVISEGQMKEDYGGGVSQVSTTLFNAAFFAGFDLDEHRAHSRWISRYPEGRETTLDWTSIDLKFTNTQDTPVVLHMYLSGGQVHARIMGEKTVEVEAGLSDRFAFTSPGTIRESGSECAPQSPKEGWSVTVYRTIRDAATGRELSRDDFTTTYRPVDEVICED
ncbi:VanW family protein [Brevibacterium samyangense]|uniref:VanW family protein n=1 Tax=Brevibacterium samyangense TaxID=366888 RepID=A0ABN2T955_9MICO